MFTGNAWTKFGFESSLRDLLDLCGNGIPERRVDDDFDVLYRPDHVRQREEGGFANCRRSQSMSGNDDVVWICRETRSVLNRLPYILQKFDYCNFK